jgi:hypothetical protein
VKRVVEPVGGDFPPLGEPGHGGERAGFETDQRVEQRLDDLGVTGAGDGLRIEVGGFGADAEVQDARASGAIDGGFAPPASGQECGQKHDRDAEAERRTHALQRSGRAKRRKREPVRSPAGGLSCGRGTLIPRSLN